MNKIKYGLKNVYYAIATIDEDGSAVYVTPVKWPGAVSLSMDPQGDKTIFRADNIAYYVDENNNGYEGDLEMVRIIDSFKKDVLGHVDDNKHVLVEDANAPVVHFALLFQFEGDVKATRHVLYNCTAGRPTVGSQTKGETKDPQTESSTITATSIYNESLGKDIVKAETNEATDETVYNNWFQSVYIPAATGGNG